MIKKSLIVASLLLVGTSAVAKDQSKYYVGMGIGSGSGTQTRDYDSGDSYTTDYDTSSTTIKFGWIYNSGNRFEISVNNISADRTGGNTFYQNDNSSDTDSEFTGYDLDYLFVWGEDSKLKPYLDLGMGVYKNDEITGYDSSSGDVETATGLALNYGVGLFYDITENIELEAAYKGKHISWNLENPDTSESITFLYTGINYKF